MGFLDKLFNRVNTQKKTDSLSNNQQVLIADKTINSPRKETTNSRGNVTINKLMLSKDSVYTLKTKFIAFDVETTGLNPKTDRIIEVGAVLFENGEVIRQYGSLINVNTHIPSSATAVNHITDDMIASAPDERKVYSDLFEFLGDALNEQTIICAHNATFDMNFLSESLMRMGYSGKIYYVDTLSLSRNIITGLVNYKQDTVATHFNLSNPQSHRAISDATICGKILYKLLECYDNEQEKKRTAFENSKPTSEEREICAYIQKIIVDNGGDIEYLGFHRNSSNYIDVSYMYSMLKFKIGKKGKYIIVDKKAVSALNLPIEQCTISEGGSEYVRAYFCSPFDLEILSSYIYKLYCECRKSAKTYLSYNSRYRDEIMDSPAMLNAISVEEMNVILEEAKIKKETETQPENNVISDINSMIKREDITISPVNDRVPLNEIKNLNNWDKGFEEGYTYWEQGDKLRKEGKLSEAIQLFDKARYNGYCAPVLFESYAMAYHKLKDYDNEIDILDEGIKREKAKTSLLKARRDKAVQLLYKQQQECIIKKERQAKKAERETKIQEEPKKSSKRPILKMNDDLVIIQSFESVSEASKETGVNAKSIRDAAKGIQKHAGGFVWRYADEFDNQNS